MLAGKNCPDRHPYRAPEYDEQKQKGLLPCGQLAEIDRVEPCLGHGTDDQEQAVCIADAPRRVGGPPENNRRQQADNDEVGIVDRNEV